MFGPAISKNTGKSYSVMKLTDLVKYDMSKIEKGDKTFNTNGYKALRIMAFGEVASFVSKQTIGTVIGLLNPKPLKSAADNVPSLCIDLEQQVFKIGYSEDLSFCKGIHKQVNSGGMQHFTVQVGCKNFVNKAVE